jgi:hypothetical protein
VRGDGGTGAPAGRQPSRHRPQAVRGRPSAVATTGGGTPSSLSRSAMAVGVAPPWRGSVMRSATSSGRTRGVPMRTLYALAASRPSTNSTSPRRPEARRCRREKRTRPRPRVGKTIREMTSLLPRFCAPLGHPPTLGVSRLTHQPSATGKGSVSLSQ